MPVCANCDVEFPNYVKVDGIARNICKRKYCLDCSPFGQHNTRQVGHVKKQTCDLCSKATINGRSKCEACNIKIRRWRLKLAAIKHKGGKCEICGYSNNIAALDFHHLDPNEKEFNLSEKVRDAGWDRIKTEVEKCQLLCANCHRELHCPLDAAMIEAVYDYDGKLDIGVAPSV